MREKKERPKIAIEGAEHTIRTAYSKIVHQKLISKPI